MSDIYNNQSTGFQFQQALERKLSSDLSKKHKDNLRHLYNHFMLFLGPDGHEMAISDLSTSRIEEFLQSIIYITKKAC